MVAPYNAAIKKTFTKGDIRRAGEKLRDYSQKKIPYSYEVFQALGVADYWRRLHMYPLNTFQPLLRLKLQRAEVKDPQVAQRLKKMPTIINKLSRITGSLDSMQDLAGIRVVFKSRSDLRKFERLFTTSRFSHKLKSKKDYIVNPKPDGYRGVHLVYRCNSRATTAPTEVQGLMIELQLRTQLQHYWATAVEAVDMFYGQALKFGDGEKQWRNFFSLVSAILAHEEKSIPAPEYQLLTKNEILESLIAAEKELNALQKLSALSKISGSLGASERKSTELKFYLLMLTKDDEAQTMNLNYKTFSGNQAEEANSAYKQYEDASRTSEQSNLDVVLVRTTGKQLAALYSNYFLDVSEFLKVLKRILAKIQ